MTSNLLYLMDPLCAWCYTFAGKVEQLMREYPDDLVLEIVPWGMFPSPRVVDKNFGDWLDREVHKIQAETNVYFGEKYYSLLHSDSLTLDSRMPSRAILSVQHIWPQRALEFMIDIERLFFFHGKNLSDETLYADLIAKMGLTPDVFLDDFRSERAIEAVSESFKRAPKISKDFPMLYFRTEKSLVPLGSRLTEYEKIKTNCANMIMKTE